MPLTDIESTPQERVDRLRQHKRQLEAEYDRIEVSEAFSDKEDRLNLLAREHRRVNRRIEELSEELPELEAPTPVLPVPEETADEAGESDPIEEHDGS